MQLFIENAPSNSNPATGALYKIGRFRIADQTDEDDLEDLVTVYPGLTRDVCLCEILSAVLALATMTQAADTSGFKLSHFSLQNSH